MIHIAFDSYRLLLRVFGLLPNYISVGEICPQDGPKCPKMTWDGRNDERCVAKRARGLSAPIRHGHPPDCQSRSSRWNLRQICPVWLPGNRTRIKIHSSGRDDPVLECWSSCSQWRGWWAGKTNTGWTHSLNSFCFRWVLWSLQKRLKWAGGQIGIPFGFIIDFKDISRIGGTRSPPGPGSKNTNPQENNHSYTWNFCCCTIVLGFDIGIFETMTLAPQDCHLSGTCG